ncbi:NBR1-Ig-like domain-containing protein [Massilia sp. SM-13]|uniref:NBR1-Ig-like domain-containing protein n=1 Tax=Pseudoduganella rhizocola TaxID=3382643 RepID=UPI0038B66337
MGLLFLLVTLPGAAGAQPGKQVIVPPPLTEATMGAESRWAGLQLIQGRDNAIRTPKVQDEAAQRSTQARQNRRIKAPPLLAEGTNLTTDTPPLRTVSNDAEPQQRGVISALAIQDPDEPGGDPGPAPALAARFVRSTVPATMVAGTQYTVSLTFQNVGTETWTGSGFALGKLYAEDAALWTNASVFLGKTVAPGQEVTVNIVVTAPSEAGTYRFRWSVYKIGQAWFGDVTDIPVLVGTGTYGAKYISSSIPTAMVLGNSYAVSFTYKNTGFATWNPGEGFAAAILYISDQAAWTSYTPTVDYPVAPGQSYTFTTTVTPIKAGAQPLRWKMFLSGCCWFGDETPATPVAVENLNSQLVSATIPASMAPGKSYPISVTWKNTGASTWTAGQFSMSVPFELDNWQPTGGALASNVPVNGTVTLTANVTAPANAGSYSMRWRLYKHNVAWFGALGPTNPVNVSGRSAILVSSNIPASMVAGTTNQISLTFKNTGSTTWTPGSTYLGLPYAADQTAWPGTQTPTVAVAVPPGATHTFTFSVVAPASPGSYPLRWSVFESGVEWFGQVSNHLVQVATPPPQVAMALPAANSFIGTSSGSATVQINGTASAAAGTALSTVALIVNGSVVETRGGVTSFSSSTMLPIGTHTLQLRATDTLGGTGFSPPTTVTVFAVSAAMSAAFVSQDVPMAMVAQRPYTVTVRMRNTGSETWSEGQRFRLGAQNPQDNSTFNGRAFLTSSVATGQVGVFTFEVTAPATTGVHNFQWQMLREMVGWFGDKSPNVPVTVSTGAGPTATLAATPRNVRVAGAATARIAFSGQGVRSGGVLSKIELMRDAGNAYVQVATLSGATSTLNLNTYLDLGAGVYRFKLRATDAGGAVSDSAPLILNVTNSALKGVISGIRTNASGQPEIFGWVCQAGNPAGLKYKVLVGGPSTDANGAVLVENLTANISTEPDQVSVATECGTPGVGHHFKAELGSFLAQYAGRTLYVWAETADLSQSVSLPCDDSRCTMPGTLRVAMSTPQNGDQTLAPSPVFLRMQLTNFDSTYDETGFSVDGEWVPAVADSPGAFSASKSGLPARSAPYTVYARVRKGNMTLFSMPTQFRVVSQSEVQPVISSPSAGANLGVGSPVLITATVPAVVQSVKVFANAILLGDAAVSGSSWQRSWTPAVAGSYILVARSYNGNGTLLAESPGVTVTAGSVGSSPTPMPIVVDMPQEGNLDGGTMLGKLIATPNGTAGYTVPLQLPPGTAGMAPALALTYDSADLAGMAGLGWKIGGVSSIDRCGRTGANDGSADAVRFDVPVGVSNLDPNQTYTMQPVDRLCLDGQRLVLVNGDSTNAAYWSPTAEYRTELESFTRVRTVMNGSQRSYTVETRDGRIAYYGDTADSYVNALGRTDGQAYRWRVSRMNDRSQNYISYLYSEDATTGENKLAEIRWGGNSANGQGHYASVRLAYETRPDARRQYVAGAPSFEMTRIKDISSYTGIDANGSGGVLAQRYTLDYARSPTSGRSLLRSVQACDGSVCLPETVFDYGTRSLAMPGFVSLGGERVGPDLVALGNNGSGSGYAKAPLDEIAVGDFNGDGKDDILERYRVGANASQQRLYESNADGTGWTVKVPFASIGGNLAVMETGDFDGDGRLDVLVADWTAGYMASNWRMCWGKLFNAGTFNCAPVAGLKDEYWGTYIEAPAPMRMVRDLNGDGKDDLVLRTGRSANFAEQTYKCLANGLGFDCVKVTGTSFNMGFGDEANGSHTSGSAFADMDGDGRTDRVDLGHCRRVLSETSGTRWECDVNADDPNRTYIVVGSSTEPGAYQFRGEWDPSPDNRTAALAPPSTGTITADFNADGYTDLVYGRATLNNSGSPIAYQGRICLSKGNGEADCGALPSSGTTTGLDHLVMTVADFDGDGQPDVLRPATDTWTADTVSNYLLCHLGHSGDTNSCEPWSGPTFYGISGQMVMIGTAVDQLYARNRSMFLGDFDGDGKPDIVNYTQGSKWQIYGAADLAKPGEALDRLVRVTNGAGLVETAEYAKLNSTEVYSPSVQAYPGTTEPQLGKLMHPGHQLVRAIHRSNGSSGWLDTEYTYHGHRYDPSRRASLGFAQIEERDVQSQIATTTWYNQAFPYAGMTRYARSLDRDGTVLLDSRVSAAVRSIAQDNGTATQFPYIGTEKRLRRDLNGAFLERTTTSSTYDDWGNPTLVTNSSYDSGDLDSPVAAVGTTAISRSYDSEKISWRIGEMRTQSETRTMAGSSIERQMAYTYDEAGRLKTETVEPNVTELRVKKTFERDSVFGLVKRTIFDWTDPQGTARTRTVSTVEYTANGRFPASQQNARSHKELLEYDPRNGALTKKTDANGLITQAEFDGFGRERHFTARDGTETWTHYKRCNANCPPHATGVQIQDFKRGAERVAVPKLLFTNKAGQVVRSVTWGFNGKTATDIEYDAQGRVWRTWQPAYASESDVLGTGVPAEAELERQFSYDDLDRVTLLQTKDGGGMLDNLTVYNGREVSFTNAKQQKKVETRDAWGRMKTVADAKNQSTTFTYDAFHNLTSTVDPLGNVVRVAYDKLGRKIELLDPDLGKIRYDVDALGQVWRQISPNQRARGPVETYSTRMSYDELGRMTARVSEDYSAGWVYDKPAAQADCKTSYSCGQLVESFTLAGSVKDFRREHRYDSKGRPDTVTVYQPDGSYISRTEYDAWGRLIRERHQPANGAERVFDRRYNGYGHLARIERGALPLWQATEADASARVLNATLGNGLSITREYYANTGHLFKDVVNRQGTAVLEEQYIYDVLGNVSSRSQYWEDPANLPTKRSGFGETFTYDALNRLETAWIAGQSEQVFTYNEIGNLTSKTSVGTYTYPASGANSIRPHAVSTVAGAGFGYDDNGNLLTAPGRATSWTWSSFNMPLRATKGSSYSDFVYGADRQRVRQVRSDGLTTYYAGAMETEVQGGTTTIKTYWPMGLGVEIERNGVTSLRWTHLDRLGSVAAITDETGTIVEKLAYDAWGARRSLTTSTPTSADGEVDNKGFTGHEMLDQLDLVHMNGRIYDPLVARFMSADTLVQDAYSSQSYNRYSYVWNNPTNHTDPSGFTAMQVVTIVGQRPVLTCDWCARDPFQWFLRELQAGARAAPRVALRASVVLDLALMPGNWNTRPGAGELSDADAPWRNSAKARYTPAQIEAMRKDGEESAAQQDSESLSSGTNSASSGSPGDPDNGDEEKKDKGKSPNQLNKEIKQGKAPKDVERVDVGKVKGEQTHAHFKDGSALNKDGTWKHGESTLSRATQKWLENNGWRLPK